MLYPQPYSARQQQALNSQRKLFRALLSGHQRSWHWENNTDLLLKPIGNRQLAIGNALPFVFDRFPALLEHLAVPTNPARE